MVVKPSDLFPHLSRERKVPSKRHVGLSRIDGAHSALGNPTSFKALKAT